MAVIGGSIYPLSSMPEFVRKLSGLTINRWAMDGFMIIFSGNDALRVTTQVYALCIIGLVLLTAAVGIMRLRRE
jgi:ABC-type multidrug transport system permease subunit